MILPTIFFLQMWRKPYSVQSQQCQDGTWCTLMATSSMRTKSELCQSWAISILPSVFIVILIFVEKCRRKMLQNEVSLPTSKWTVVKSYCPVYCQFGCGATLSTTKTTTKATTTMEITVVLRSYWLLRFLRSVLRNQHINTTQQGRLPLIIPRSNRLNNQWQTFPWRRIDYAINC